MAGYCPMCGQEFKTPGWFCEVCAEAGGFDPMEMGHFVPVMHIKGEKQEGVFTRLLNKIRR